MQISFHIPEIAVSIVEYIALATLGLVFVALFFMAAWYVFRQVVGWAKVLEAIRFYKAAQEARRNGRPDPVPATPEDKAAIEARCRAEAEERVQFFSDENQRLHNKCEAICEQLRRMKRRGEYTGYSRPVRTF